MLDRFISPPSVRLIVAMITAFASAAAPLASSEDCLALNVWTPAKSASEQLPVMVWIHGGGFTIGSGASPRTAAEVLAGDRAVVVTFYYRLGALGFLAHPGLSRESDRKVSGNYGLSDQIAALRYYGFPPVKPRVNRWSGISRNSGQ